MLVGLTTLGLAVLLSSHLMLPLQFETSKLASLPEQIVGFVTVGIGFEFTVTVEVTDAKHEPNVQVAIYDLVTVGVTVRWLPVAPSPHVTVPVQLVTVNVADSPSQIDGLLTDGFGEGDTVTTPDA